MPLTKVSTLIVDDDIRMLRMMQRILELEGYRVRTASDGKAALDAFDEENPDLVLLDIMMPGLDGYQVLESIRKHSDVPIIMITAKLDVDSIKQAVDLGADDYVKKPFTPAELVARINAKLRRTEQDTLENK